MNRCVVIGGSGFLGRHLLDLGSEWAVIGTACRRHHPGLVHLDLTKIEEAERKLSGLRPDVVVYAAGLTSVDACEETPDTAEFLNCEAPARLARSLGARMVYFSTDYVFDGRGGPYGEHDPANPLNAYGRSKLAGEQAVLGAHSSNVVVRVSGLFDANGTRDGSFSAIPDMKSIAAEDDRVSSPVRVDDVRRAVTTVLSRPEGGVFHCGGHPLSRYEFRQIVALHRGFIYRVVPTANAVAVGAPRPRNTSLGCQRLQSLGWRPTETSHWFDDQDRIVKYCHSLSAPVLAAHGIDGVLLDCVGGLLGRRRAAGRDGHEAAIDVQCEHATDGPAFWREAQALMPHLTTEDIQDRIAAAYAPNPDIWHRIPAMRGRTKVALLNNGPSATFRRWDRKYGLASVFDALLNSEELGVRKPAPEFFLKAAQAIDVAPERCLVIDDNPDYLDGATACGMRVCRTVEVDLGCMSQFVLDPYGASLFC